MMLSQSTRSVRFILAGLGILTFSTIARAADSEPRPNILWLTSEDHGTEMGCYGDQLARTPNVDRLAAKGMLYRHAWSNAPVCAPARTTIISGLYPPSTGAEHMRSLVAFPKGKAMFPHYLREVGYYCTNNAKTDYNLKDPGQTWDQSSAKAHWKNRKDGQPFFAVFNSQKSHESQIRTRPHKAITDPAKVRVPAYHPDTPEVRQDWAQYYDKVSEADADAGRHLRELEAAGLAEDTIVFYYGDHGSGMPRSKRWPYNTGLHVPLVVYIPEKFKDLRSADYQPGGQSNRLVSFVDLAPTVLSLAGIEPPSWMQGTSFLGKYQAPAPPFAYGFRGRMDERYDLVRSVTDGRHVYIRNYMPHKPYGQYLEYMFQTPTTQVWHRLHAEGRLTPAQDAFWKSKPPEELYDLQADPDEVHNLASSQSHEKILNTLRKAHRDWELKIKDVGFLPEGEIHRRSVGSSPYDVGQDPSRFPFARILDTADRASNLAPSEIPALLKALADDDSAVRYWAALGLSMRGEAGVRQGQDELIKALEDSSPFVQVAASEALVAFGNEKDRERGLPVLARLADPAKNDQFVTMAALNAVGTLGEKAKSIRKALVASGATTFTGPGASEISQRYVNYIPRLLTELREPTH